MIITHEQAVAIFGSPYQINKQIAAGRLYRVARGFYSDQRHVDPYELCSLRYPDAVVTADSAFYLHGLTDVVPEKVHLVTSRTATRFSDQLVVQHFSEDRLLSAGRTTFDRGSTRISIYSKERMLVELMRVSTSMSFDYYKELIGSYRSISDELDLYAVEEYIGLFERNGYMFDILQKEVL